MKDILQDIVKHTHGLGFLDLVKITGTSDQTAIDSMAEDRSVILQGSFHKSQAEMVGTFGMPQLNKLDIHLKCPEYKDKAKITVTKGNRNGVDTPIGIHFENEKGDYDKEFESNGLTIVCDLKSWLYLKDVEIDYSDDLLNGGFKIKNPNAERTCGCGTSFSA